MAALRTSVLSLQTFESQPIASITPSLLAEPVPSCLISVQMFLCTSKSERFACQMQTLAQQSEIGPESLHVFLFKFSNV